MSNPHIFFVRPDIKSNQKIELVCDSNIEINKQIMKLLGLDGLSLEVIDIHMDVNQMNVHIATRSPLDGIDVVSRFEKATRVSA
jgi:hypothetical protein